MARTTRRGKDFLPQGFSTEDLKLAKWFLGIVASLYPGALHSHATVIPLPDKQGRRKRTSLSVLFHEQWPHVQMGDILAALAHAGFITPPQRIEESTTSTESGGYTFQLVSRGKRMKPRPEQKAIEDRRK